jgi:urease accessory protein
VQSATAVRVGVDAQGISRVVDLRCEAPQLLRITEGGGDTPSPMAQLHVVGGAAGPLGGDALTLTMDLDPGAQVRLRSVAASLAQPDPLRRPSSSMVRVAVGAGAVLDAWPEPLVSVKGSHHTMDVTLDVASDARVRWVDEVVLGRHDEPGGTVVLRQRLTCGGRVVMVSETTLGSEAVERSHGANGPYRVVVSAVGPGEEPSAIWLGDDVRAVRCELGDGWSSWTAVGSHHVATRQALARLGLER